MTREQKEGKFNAARVIKALGRIGYEPAFALLDIADNSLSAGASRIAIKLEKVGASDTGRGRRRATISSFYVIDNGSGMDADGLDNALTLGASESYYTPNTLSKFGMGLKSAAFSLGNCLEIISRHHGDLNKVRKVILDYDRVLDTGRYVYDVDEPSEDDVVQLNAFCGSDSGTIIKITKPHTQTLPPISEIISSLRRRVGIVYYYYLKGIARPDQPLSISIDDQEIEPFDPLFMSEVAGDLDELNWNGLDVRWITHPTPIQLDPAGQVYADLEITQLPHPPSVYHSGLMSRKECREKYMIESGTYGFYVYRNHRLIAWPEDRPVKLYGERVRASDLYAFRGRILITSDADDLLNIDISKSRIQLSEIAIDQIYDKIYDAMRKSRSAWNRRSEAVQRAMGETTNSLINAEIDRAEELAERDDAFEEEILPPPEKAEREQRRRYAATSKPIDEQEGQRLREQGERVQHVDTLDHNQLWERAHDPSEGLIVRINQSHRFYRELILGQQEKNPALSGALSVLLFALARGEYGLVCQFGVDSIADLLPSGVVKSLSEQARNRLIEGIMQEYRERVGANLSEMIRRMDIAAAFGDSRLDE